MKNILFILFIIGITVPVAGQDSLLIKNSARNAGLADAGISMPTDLNVMDYNPAGLGVIKQMQVSFIHNEWIDPINLESLAFCMNFIGIGTIGAHVIYLYMPDFDVFDRDGNSLDKANASDMIMTVGFSKNVFSSHQFTGINVKYLQQDMDDYSASSIAFDFGWLSLIKKEILTINDIKAGVVFKNLGINLNKAGQEETDMPMRLVLGVSGNLLNIQELKNHKLYLTSDFLIKLSGESANKFHTGLEYGFREFLFFRIGYKAGYTSKGVTSGLGLNYFLPRMVLSLNYSVLFNSYLNNNHVIGLVLKFTGHQKKIGPSTLKQKDVKSEEEKVENLEKEFDELLEKEDSTQQIKKETINN